PGPGDAVPAGGQETRLTPGHSSLKKRPPLYGGRFFIAFVAIRAAFSVRCNAFAQSCAEMKLSQ
ncbi:hypothetical protein, partial [Acinetobacter baumannii]|uniref:hypothetical protein n=1 Tax=Acinetobacter baumannii TaxID=470 RepID=UPI004038FEDA